MFITDNVYEHTPENETPKMYLLFFHSFLHLRMQFF